MENNQTTESTRLRKLLKEKGMTQTQLASRMGVTLSTVKAILTAKSITLNTMRRIAEILEVPTWQILVSPEEAAPFAKAPVPTSQEAMETAGRLGALSLAELVALRDGLTRAIEQLEESKKE